MSKTLAEVTRDAAKLSADEKFLLAGILLDSTTASLDSVKEIEAAWDAEIQKRLQDIRSGKVRGIPLNDVKKKIEAKFTK